jgi:hypothetical protein
VLKEINMRRICSHLIIALLTFALGVASTEAVTLLLASIISLLFLFGVPLFIVGTVLHHGAILKSEWRPFIGKGFLAIFLWLLPSPIVILANLIYWIDPANREALYRVEHTMSEKVVWQLTVSIFTIVYCSVGAGLCLWVKRRKISEHWLLRNL